MRKIVGSLIVLGLLGACASSSKPPRKLVDYIDRTLKNAPGEAQPGKIVATEVGFAKMAREEGQWTAFRHYAAPGAMIHGRNGGVPAAQALAELADPEAAVQWAPKEVWMSCDGTLAVSTGRFRDPDGLVGNFITVWQRQADGEYRWIYDGGVPDNPQPQPLPAGEPDEGEIVVTSIDSIRGHVADCRTPESPLPQLPESVDPDDAPGLAKLSPDGTLAWRWAHVGEGTRVFVSSILRDGAWEEALMVEIPPSERAD